MTSSLVTRSTKSPFQSKKSDPILRSINFSETGGRDFRNSDVSYRSINLSLANGEVAVATPVLLAQAKHFDYVKNLLQCLT